MKKLIGLISFFVILIIIFLIISNQEKSYEVKYDLDSYEVTEKYNKDDKLYYFTVIKDSNKFDFTFDKKYSNSRKIVKKVKETKKNDYICVNLKISNVDSVDQCIKDDKYSDGFIAGLVSVGDADVKKKYNNIQIYNDKLVYYIWNGKGITNIITKDKYNFLKKESYDNKISYKYDDKIIFADYDSSREFNKFYIFDSNKKEFDEWTFDFKISTNSYFNGDMDGYLYLFDKKNKVQYKINLNKKAIEKCSDKDGGVFFDKEWTNYTINKLVYNELTFNKEYDVNFLVDKNTLYYQYKGSSNMIKASNKDITSIIYRDNKVIYYLSDQFLYRYTLLDGEEILISNFEWNFTSNNKIFIFD